MSYWIRVMYRFVEETRRCDGSVSTGSARGPTPRRSHSGFPRTEPWPRATVPQDHDWWSVSLTFGDREDVRSCRQHGAMSSHRRRALFQDLNDLCRLCHARRWTALRATTLQLGAGTLIQDYRVENSPKRVPATELGSRCEASSIKGLRQGSHQIGPGMMRLMNSSKRGTVKAVSP